MKLFTVAFLSSIAFTSSLSAQSNSLDTNIPVNFYNGENNGAMDVATSFYDILDTSQIETSILDIDNNGAAEIGVRFLDNCSDNGCLTTILFYSENRWLEIYSEQVDKIELENTNGDVANIISSNNIEWQWYTNKFIGRAVNSQHISQLTDPIEDVDLNFWFSNLSDQFDSVTEYRIDLDKNGTVERIALLNGVQVCNGNGRCIGHVINEDNTYGGKIFHYPNELHIQDNENSVNLVSNNPNSTIIYAFEDQYINVENIIKPMPVKVK
jgi:hypothetical protein